MMWSAYSRNNVQILIKIGISLAIILIATAGLIGVMPLTGALVLVWMYLENQGNPAVMQAFSKGALWGMLPTLLFFFAAFLCFKKQLPLPQVLGISFGVWTAAALVHQWLVK